MYFTLAVNIYLFTLFTLFATHRNPSKPLCYVKLYGSGLAHTYLIHFDTPVREQVEHVEQVEIRKGVKIHAADVGVLWRIRRAPRLF